MNLKPGDSAGNANAALPPVIPDKPDNENYSTTSCIQKFGTFKSMKT